MEEIPKPFKVVIWLGAAVEVAKIVFFLSMAGAMASAGYWLTTCPR